MPILEALVAFIVAVGTTLTISSYYSKMADQYMKDKNEKAYSIRDAKLFSFQNSVITIQKSKILKGIQKDEPLSAEQHHELEKLSEDLMIKTVEYREWRNYLEEIACNLREGAKDWALSGVIIGVGLAVFVLCSLFAIELFFFGLNVMWIIEIVLAVPVTILIIKAMKIYFYALSKFNYLDTESKNYVQLRTWRIHS